MPERDIQEILDVLRRLEGMTFALVDVAPLPQIDEDCGCEYCACHVKACRHCNCVPVCHCHGYTKRPFDSTMNSLLGLGAILPIEDVLTLMELRDKAAESIRELYG